MQNAVSGQKHRPHDRLHSYLEDYRRDRNLVWTTWQRAKVDRIYRTDPKIHSWTAHWHQRTGTPYLERRGQLLFPEDTAPETRLAVEQQHHQRHRVAGKS